MRRVSSVRAVARFQAVQASCNSFGAGRRPNCNTSLEASFTARALGPLGVPYESISKIAPGIIFPLRSEVKTRLRADSGNTDRKLAGGAAKREIVGRAHQFLCCVFFFFSFFFFFFFETELAPASARLAPGDRAIDEHGPAGADGMRSSPRPTIACTIRYRVPPALAGTFWVLLGRTPPRRITLGGRATKG